MTVAREMLSGPDLGGGFLFQLSLDRDKGGATRFTYHAQEGGLDAQGPPRGSPSPLGFQRTAVPCQFGGRECWHREFELAESLAPQVRRAYHRLRFVIGVALGQEYAAEAVPLDAGLTELADRVLAPLSSGGTPVWVVGHAAAFLLGAGTAPHVIELETSREGVREVGERLEEYLIEPVAETRWGEVPRYAGRAFVGTLVSGVRVEWSARNRAPAASRVSGSDRALEETPTLDIERGGRRFPVARPEYALRRAMERGDEAAIRAIVAVLRDRAVDPTLLAGLSTRTLTDPALRRVVEGLLRPH